MEKKKIALIQADWHNEIVRQCRESFLSALDEEFKVDVVTVPGSLEIPLQAKLKAKTGEYAAVCCVGFVTDGGIYRHEFVAHAVLQGIMRAQLDTEVPILSAILTPQESFAEDGSNRDQYDFFMKHMVVKGKELAAACMKIVEV